MKEKKSKKYVFLSDEIHAELKTEAREAKKMLNQAFADDIISLGLERWRSIKKKRFF